MRLLEFLREGAPDELKRIGWMAAVSGLANALLVELISSVGEATSEGQGMRVRFFLLYLVCFAIYYVANRAALLQANETIEGLLKNLRLRIMNKLRRSELQTIESLGRGDLYTKLSTETKHLSSSFPVLVNGFQQLILLGFCLLYVAYLSIPAFLAVTLLTGASLLHLKRLGADYQTDLGKVMVCEGELVDSLSHMTDGFKEIRLNQKKNDAVYKRFSEITDEVEEITVGMGDQFTAIMLFTYVYAYAVVGIVAFVLPQLLQGYEDIVFKLTGASLFCIGPVVSLANLAPLASQAEVGLLHLDLLETTLEEGASKLADDPEAARKRFLDFKTVTFQSIMFSYRGPDGTAAFTSGPWNLTLNRGDIVFVAGGNGAGKSTALKLITRLYAPDSGAIRVDGTLIEPGSSLLGYRELFSCIFADFHLFDRLYGLEDVDPDRVSEMLKEFGLVEKVTYENGSFSTVALSTGQRKRLALIACLLEDRPIYVFDEPTADQDAWFRDVFFNQLLPDLKKRGKTVICVTHDDRYSNCCDRMIQLYLGEMKETDVKEVG